MIHVESRHVYTLVSRGYDTPGRSSSATLQSTSSITATTPTLSASSPLRAHPASAASLVVLATIFSGRSPIPSHRDASRISAAVRSNAVATCSLSTASHTPSLAKMSARSLFLTSPRNLRHGETPDGRRHLVSERAREEDAGKPRVSQEEPLGTNLGVASRSAPPRGDSSSGVLQTRAFRPGAMVERELLRGRDDSRTARTAVEDGDAPVEDGDAAPVEDGDAAPVEDGDAAPVTPSPSPFAGDSRAIVVFDALDDDTPPRRVV